MKIVKVLSVVDTRQYEEQGDSFVPIPGSGNSNVCGRCGREHEIHWTVLLEGGDQAVVGGSCAKSDSVGRKLVMSAERFASREKRLVKEIATYEARLVDLEGALAQVQALPRPPIVEGTKTLSDGKIIPIIRMGDATEIWCHISGTQDPERRRCAENCWISLRLAERTKVKENAYQLKDLIKSTKKALEGVREKLSASINLQEAI